jgi:hypothetical protein
MNPVLLEHSSVDKHLGYFRFGAVMNHAALNIHVQVIVWTCVFIHHLCLCDSSPGSKYGLSWTVMDDTEFARDLLGLQFLLCKADLGRASQSGEERVLIRKQEGGGLERTSQQKLLEERHNESSASSPLLTPSSFAELAKDTGEKALDWHNSTWEVSMESFHA